MSSSRGPGRALTTRLLAGVAIGMAVSLAPTLTAQAHPVPPDSSTPWSPVGVGAPTPHRPVPSVTSSAGMGMADPASVHGGTYYGSASVDRRVVRLTTARFRRAATARRAGYTVEFKDRLGFTCISDIPAAGHRSKGAMGVHLVNPAYLGSTDPAHPAAVLYEPGRAGTMQLVGLEFLVVEPEQPSPPGAFGQPFMFTPAGDPGVNRFMPDAFYSLHVWVWKHNPSGRFAMWNPRVHCPLVRHG